eukprot:13106679-Alexandrium_andersonii.AAC.1
MSTESSVTTSWSSFPFRRLRENMIARAALGGCGLSLRTPRTALLNGRTGMTRRRQPGKPGRRSSSRERPMRPFCTVPL